MADGCVGAHCYGNRSERLFQRRTDAINRAICYSGFDVNMVAVVGWSGIAGCIDPALVTGRLEMVCGQVLESQEGPT